MKKTNRKAVPSWLAALLVIILFPVVLIVAVFAGPVIYQREKKRWEAEREKVLAREAWLRRQKEDQDERKKHAADAAARSRADNVSSIRKRLASRRGRG